MVCYGLVTTDLFFQTAFTTQKDFGKGAREAAWAAEPRTLHGLQSVEVKMLSERHTFRVINIMADEARRRAEIARLLSFLKLNHKFLHHCSLYSTTELSGKKKKRKKKNHELAKTKTNCFSVTLTVAFFVNVFRVLIPSIIFLLPCRLRELHTLKRQSGVVCKTKGIRY